ncbi:NAD(P)H-hydrate dehydratase [Sphingobacterium sp. 1.A.5]|uniref:NAD(P)H-hydrate dehydratase n=1 Tax=Sphingobacterium sp. 1.A.5 TaxID=2044604 RepID=UPI000C0BF320|nr:NAD(P)H-hydrate dehydratase [Sphingobacterium sp. 1.A.5]
MKILNAEQLRIVDQETIQKEGINSWELMERASSIATYAILNDFVDLIKELPIVVVCGKGNNGGDGLAIARQLRESGYDVEVRLLYADQYSPDNLLNQKKLDDIKFFGLKDDLDFPMEGILIDCLFGYGLNTALGEEWTSVISQMNDFQGVVVSIDMPSGLMLESTGKFEDNIVRATKVYTFQCPKLSLLLPDNAVFVGDFEILDIGLNENSILEQQTEYKYVESDMLDILVRSRSRFSHKGTYGHIALIGGSLGKMGAVLMSSKAALRSGCGLITAYIPRCGYNILQIGFPEAMVMLDSGEEEIKDFNIGLDYSAYGVGIGMGKDEETSRGFGIWLQSLDENTKLLLDADALNILSENEQLLKFLPKNSILTPHPKELSRLIGEWENDLDKLNKAKDFTREYQVVLVVKGANTAVINPNGEIFFNSTGNAGMATGGTGDVLTGVITSLLGQGYDALDAAVLGVFIHGAAGDYAKGWVGEISLIAGDLIDYLPSAFMDLEKLN